jgi:hypothetical protein
MTRACPPARNCAEKPGEIDAVRTFARRRRGRSITVTTASKAPPQFSGLSEILWLTVTRMATCDEMRGIFIFARRRVGGRVAVL